MKLKDICLLESTESVRYNMYGNGDGTYYVEDPSTGDVQGRNLSKGEAEALVDRLNGRTEPDPLLGLNKLKQRGDIKGYTANADGTIDIEGDLTIQGMYEDLDLPKINTVNGDFSWYFIPEGSYNVIPHLPKQVNGTCNVPINGQIVKSSQLPKCKSFIVSGTGVSVFMDDDTFSACEQIYLGGAGAFTGGFEHLPRELNISTVAFAADDLSGIPPQINCETFDLTISSPEALKGFAKRVKSIKCNVVATVRFPRATPLVGLLKVLKTDMLSSVIRDSSINSSENQQLRRVVNKLINTDKDVFEIQEALVEAGFKEFARM